jgi:hypothetical protein
MALPLSLRKDIRDNEPKFAEAAKKISGILGVEVTFDVNNEAIYAMLKEANNNKAESFSGPVAQYFAGLAKQLETITKEPLVKEELLRVLSAKKIGFQMRKDAFPKREEFGGNSYIGVEFKDGALNIICPVAQFWCNMSNIEQPKETNIVDVMSRFCTPAGTAPLTLRVNEASAKAKWNDSLKVISTATGQPFTFTYDLMAIHNALPVASGSSDYRQTFPLHFNSYLENIAKQITTLCADAMVKEEINRVATAHQIGIRIHKAAFTNEEKANWGNNSYIGVAIENGILWIIVPPTSWWTNVSELANVKGISLLSHLARCHTAPGTLPIPIRQALRETDAKRDAAVKAVGTALGVEMKLDWNPFAVWTDLADHKDRDQLPHASVRYIEGLAANFATACKDDMIKEAVLEVTKNKTLKFKVVKGSFSADDKKKYGNDSYIGLSFEGGDIVIVIPSSNFWCNMDNIKTAIKVEKML